MAGTIAVAVAGCGTSSSSAPAAPTGGTTTSSLVATPSAEATTAAASADAESCATCHNGNFARSGAGHQTEYDKLYKNGVYTVSGMAIASDGVSKTTLTFTLKNNGTPVDCTSTASDFSIGSYYGPYDAATGKFTYPGPSIMSLKPSSTGTAANDITYNSTTGVCTFVKTFTSATDTALVATITTADGVISVYGADGILEKNSAKHMSKATYPFAGVLRIGTTMGAATAPYTSAANVTGCENCHTQPFNKHAYIPGTVDDNTAGSAATTQQFYVCKTCHTDERSGGHALWQLLMEAKLADKTTAEGQALRDRAVAVHGGDALTSAESTKYAYKTRLMNDVHMSHAMEFPYPQSMRNCVTCHSGKMDDTTGIFKSANFKGETCISCHSFDGITGKMKAAAYDHSSYVADKATLTAATCTLCHDGATAPTFKTIHTGGYDPKIYASDGTRYSTSFIVSIDSASIDSSNLLDVKFSATGTVGSMSASDINPTILIGLYGYNTKDFIVGPHSSDSDGKRYLEYVVGGSTRNPDRIKTVSASGGSWEITADLSAWASMITDGTVKRIEIAVLPELKNASGTVVGLDAPSKTFDLATNAFVTYYNDIVNVQKTAFTTSSGYAATKGCNTCHDQLATTFHSGIRGGNIKACRLCHVKSSGGSHLEMQSRSIDSYVHAIHSFQAFDVDRIDFADTFDAMEYTVHTETYFPRFGQGDGATDCESCHVSGMYNVPDQAKSLPALLSASDTITGKTRSIGTVPSYVTGPAAMACGGCHRAQKVVEDDAGGLASVFQHWKVNGYLIENVSTLWDATVAKVMAQFK